MVSGETPAMTDLAEVLQGPNAREEAFKILERLDDLERQIAHRIAAGAAPQDFERLTAIARSLAETRSLMLGIHQH